MRPPPSQNELEAPILERWRIAEATADLAEHEWFNATIAFGRGYGAPPQQSERDCVKRLRLHAKTLFKLANLLGASAGEVHAAAWHGSPTEPAESIGADTAQIRPNPCR